MSDASVYNALIIPKSQLGLLVRAVASEATGGTARTEASGTVHCRHPAVLAGLSGLAYHSRFHPRGPLPHAQTRPGRRRNSRKHSMDYRLLLFLYRKEGITHAEFRDHYEYIHIPLTRELTGSLFPSLHARRYIERSPDGEANVLMGDKTGQECDAVVEVAFRDEEAAQAFFAATNAGAVEERLRKDTEQFLDRDKMRVVKIGDALETRREG